MRKNIFFLLIFFLFSALQAEAQELKVTQFYEKTSDLTARQATTGKQNSNGDWCGLIRVRYAGDDLEFESKNIKEVEHITGEYLVWMNPKSIFLTIRAKGFQPLDINFKTDYNQKEGIKSKTTYVMIVEAHQNQDVGQQRKRLKVMNFEELSDRDAMVGENVRKDINGKERPIVKVAFPQQGANFTGSVDTTFFRTSEYWVYMTVGAKHLRVLYPGHYPLDVKFKPLAMKRCYSLEIQSVPEDPLDRDAASFTLGVGLNVMPFIGPSISLGFDFKHINAEVGGTYGLGKSGDIYIYNKSSELQDGYSYTPMRAFLRVGYDMKVAPIVSFTPQIGGVFNNIKGSRLSDISSNADKVLDGASAISGSIGARLMVAPFNKVFRLYLTPEYDFALSKDKNFEALSAFDSKIKSWAEGLNVNLGLLFYF